MWAKLDQVLSRDVIQPTAQQIQAIGEIIETLALEDEEEAELALKHAIRRLYLALTLLPPRVWLIGLFLSGARD